MTDDDDDESQCETAKPSPDFLWKAKKINLDISMEIAWKTKANMEVSKNLAADSDECLF